MNNKEYWIFTFMQKQKEKNKYVKVFWNYEIARQKMIDKYWKKWAFQYEDEEKAWVNMFNLELLDIIE